MAEYYNVTTNLGDAEIAAAITNNAKIQITHIAFGDGAGSVPTPSKIRTTLVREVHRQAVTKYERHPANPNWIVIETIIPSDIGGFTIREMGIIGNGKLISHGSHAPFEKVADPSGVSEYRLKFTQNITDGNVVSITLDDSLIYATQAWVEENFIKRNEIVDNLVTDDANSPLSAKMGKQLNDNKLNKNDNAASATKLQTARNIENSSFDGSKDIAINRITSIMNYGYNPSYSHGSKLQLMFSTLSSVVTSEDYCDLLTLNSWHDSTGGLVNAIAANKKGVGLYHWQGQFDSVLWSVKKRLAYYDETRNVSNTTVDSNGFIKAASPVVSLYADKIGLNEEAQLQNIEFEKLGVGNYLLKNSSGLSNDGWYIEQPKDANGNAYHAVVYKQLENGDISVKTFEQKLDETRIVADLDRPVDIKENRFISIRLNELPSDVTAPQNPNVVDNEDNPAPSKYHVLENGIWVISDEDAEILADEKYQAYLQSLKPLTRRQFKLALLENGLLDQIENSISAIEDDQTRARIQIEYTEATEFHRMSDSVMYMCQLLNLTGDQVDQMWTEALNL